MNLPSADRKQLWSAAYGMCSYHHKGGSCQKKLFTSNETMDTNLGEECHIIGDKPGSARYQKEFVEKETYNNAILLCHDHHRIVDDNPDVYTVDVLKQMKNEHEQILSERLLKKEILPFELKNTQLSLNVDKAKEDVIGLDIQKPTLFSNVGVNVQVKEARNVVGMKISGGLNAITTFCPNCRRFISIAYSGQQELQIKECPYCNHPL